MNSKIHRVDINGFLIEVADAPQSLSPEIIAYELSDDCYGLDRIDFTHGEVVIDIGAHIGMFAIYTALRFPQVLIHAFEPFPENFELLEQNLERNGITNVRLHRLGVTSDGRFLEMVTNPKNSGGSTCHSRTLDHGRISGIPSTTLDHIFDSRRIDKCKLLKIDCEGFEYEILFSTQTLSKVEYLSGEFHHNQLLQSYGYKAEELFKYCETQIAQDKLFIKTTHMSE